MERNKSLGSNFMKNRIQILKSAIQEGIDSGIANEFNPTKHLEALKANKVKRDAHMDTPPTHLRF